MKNEKSGAHDLKTGIFIWQLLDTRKRVPGAPSIGKAAGASPLTRAPFEGLS
jgi:hypothetical protein